MKEYYSATNEDSNDYYKPESTLNETQNAKVIEHYSVTSVLVYLRILNLKGIPKKEFFKEEHGRNTKD
eukprot:3826650-Amphidinium_carterae.1